MSRADQTLLDDMNRDLRESAGLYNALGTVLGALLGPRYEVSVDDHEDTVTAAWYVDADPHSCDSSICQVVHRGKVQIELRNGRLMLIVAKGRDDEQTGICGTYLSIENVKEVIADLQEAVNAASATAK